MLQLTQHAQQPLPPEDGLESGDQQRYQFRLIKLETRVGIKEHNLKKAKK